MAVLLSNNATGRLGGSINATQTSISLMSGNGAKFPSPTGGDWFPLTVVNATGDLEIMRCTARRGDTLTVVRGQEGTIGLAFSAGSRAELRLTKAAISELQDEISELQDEKLAISANLSDLANAGTARQNLGLGTAATRNVGETSGNVLEAKENITYPAATGTFDATRSARGFIGYAGGQSTFPSNLPAGVNLVSASNTNGSVHGAVAWRENKLYLYDFYANMSYTVTHTGNILTTTGNNNKFPMSQKAVTDAINNSAIGVGQTWQDVTGSRAPNTNYTNSAGRPVMVILTNNSNKVYTFMVDGVVIAEDTDISGTRLTTSFIVPNGSTYKVSTTGGINRWAELR